MQPERINLDDYEECISSPQLCTNCDENMEFGGVKEVMMEESKELPADPPRPPENPRTSDLMEDICSRPPALPPSLDYLMDWRNSNVEGRSSIGRFSLESPANLEPRLSLNQAEKEAKLQELTKINPFEQNNATTQYMRLEGIAEVIGDSEPEKKIQPPSVSGTDPAFKGCNCKKSRCLKLYCECFAAQRNCGPGCNCVECHNTEEHAEDKQSAMARIMAKNPFGLLRRTTDAEPLIGCNCKKSSCQQNYCSCYKRGVPCNHLCKCVECENRKTSAAIVRAQGDGTGTGEGRKYIKIFTSQICVNK